MLLLILVKITFHLQQKTVSGISLRFIDPYTFWNASLNKLANNLPTENFNIT